MMSIPKRTHRPIVVSITIIAWSIVLFCATTSLRAEDVVLLKDGDLMGWDTETFAGETTYSSIVLDDEKVIRAQSQSAASGKFRKISVNLKETPYLNWRWRVENYLTGNDEKTKAGDDYPARLYVIVSGGLLFWKTRALNYVWSSRNKAGEQWPNAFTSNAQMVVVRDPTSPLNQWQTEKRNVRDDFRKLFGIDITKIDAVAFMTDTDNTKQSATAHYGEIYFSAD